MFIRTTNLLLRPAWREDAARLAAAFGVADVVTMLSNAPWPYTQGDATCFIDHASAARMPELLIVAPGDDSALVGGVGLVERDAGIELGYWIARGHRGRGHATEAAQALVLAARDSLRLDRLISAHFVDNPASGRVLCKTGFTPTGIVTPRPCRARGHEVQCVEYALDLRRARFFDLQPGCRRRVIASR